MVWIAPAWCSNVIGTTGFPDNVARRPGGLPLHGRAVPASPQRRVVWYAGVKLA
jgi:hypothetical protein